MGMSNAERQRKFRLLRDSDPQRRDAYLEACKLKYSKDKKVGKKKLVHDMTKREHRHAKKVWKERQKKSRKRRKEVIEMTKRLVTPPSSPGSDINPPSRQKKQSKSKKGKDMAKCYRTNKALELEIKDLKSKCDMYKKRWQREKEKVNGKSNDSPRTVTRKLLRNYPHARKKVKRALFQFHVLVKQLKSRYEEEKKIEKLRFTRNISGSVLKKYKLKTETFRLLGINTSRKKQKERTCLSKRICGKVKKFYLREDNSRVMPGLKMTVTKAKKKKQKRILCDTLKNLHEKFQSEGKLKLSYALFCKLRPFWVLFPTDADRNTCLCKMCDNIELKANALFKSDILKSGKPETLVKELVCDEKNYKCMYGECQNCRDRTFTTNTDSIDKEVCWYEWKSRREKRSFKGKPCEDKVISFTVKESMTCSVRELLSIFHRDIKSYQKHIYNCRRQYRYFKERRETLKENECLVQVDFSENYVCKLSQEIQSMHFGASKKQITLHTGVIFIGQNKGKTFCTVSESLNHGPGGIWGHLKKVLIDLREEYPAVNSIEFFSDGPTTRYKQKGNFFMLATEPKKMGFESVKWSFFEAGHGKGIPDAVGGTLKREADRKVKFGQDIPSGEVFVDTMKYGKPKVTLVTEKEIEFEQQKLDSSKAKIRTIPGTMKLHQVIVVSPICVMYRNLSCACESECENCNQKLQRAIIVDAKDKSQEGDSNKNKKPEQEELNDTEIPNQEESSVNQKPTQEGPKQTEIPNQEELSSNKKSRIEPDQTEIPKQEKPSERYDKTENMNTYKKYLQELNKCGAKSFTNLKSKCKKIASEIPDLNSDPRTVSLYENKLSVDFDASVHVPEDHSAAKDLFPCEVISNGNCLPSCGSVFAFGNPEHTAEIRVRIILELVLNENKYIEDKYLALGLENEQKKNIANTYAQYSECYLPGMKLNKDLVKSVFRMETISITKDKSYMGMWQVHALSNVLKVPIFSLYPKLGNQNVRSDLHRLVIPYIRYEEGNPVHILWTSQRNDMTDEHWVPNHFVPVVPYSATDEETDINNNKTSEETIYIFVTESAADDNPANLHPPCDTEKSSSSSQNFSKTNPPGDEQQSKNENSEETYDTDKTNEINENTSTQNSSHHINDISTGDRLENGDKDAFVCGTKADDNNEKIKAKDKTEDENLLDETNNKKNTHDTETAKRTQNNENVHSGDKSNDQTGDKSEGNVEQKLETKDDKVQQDSKAPTVGFVGKHVILNYYGKLYPGFVEKCLKEDLFIECMKRVGKKSENRFYWPKKMKDKCWYKKENIACLIREPAPIQGTTHYKVEDNIWKDLMNKDNA